MCNTKCGFRTCELPQVLGVTSSVPYESFEVIDSTTTKFINVMACKPLDKPWPDHSFAVHDNDNGYVGFHDDFTATDSDQWQVYDNGSGLMVNIDNSNQQLNTSQIFNDLRHFNLDVVENIGQAMVFDNHKYNGETSYFGQAEYIFHQLTDSPLGTSSFTSSDTVFSNNYHDALTLEPSRKDQNIDYQYFEEITTSSYDYSKVDNHKMAIITFVYDAKNPDTKVDMSASWTLYGPIKGTFPMTNGLPGYEHIVAGDTKIDITEVNLIRHYESSNYQDYINKQVQTGNIPLASQLNRTEQRIHQYFIKLEK